MWCCGNQGTEEQVQQPLGVLVAAAVVVCDQNQDDAVALSVDEYRAIACLLWKDFQKSLALSVVALRSTALLRSTNMCVPYSVPIDGKFSWIK